MGKRPIQMLSSSRCGADYSKFEPNVVVISDAGSFHFLRPMVFQREKSGNGIILSNTESDLIAFGSTLEDAMADLRSETEFVWEEYAMEEDSRMDKVARDYKKWLLDNVERRN